MKRKIPALIILIAVCLSLASCGTGAIAGLFGKGAKENEAKPASTEAIDIISSEDDQRVKSLISDYFSCLYAEPVESYYEYSLTGKIPPNIREFISKTTISTAEGNTEIGLHLPRYLEMNGLMAVSFSINKGPDRSGQEVPLVDSRFMENRNGSSFYYVKAELIAQCINENNFKLLYTFNPQTKQWHKKDPKPLDEGIVDYIRIQARYVAEARKEDGIYKLVTVKESNTRDDMEFRLMTFNNEFFTRLPYLNISKTEDGKAYINDRDQKTYEEEKAVIESFFKSLFKSFDSESGKLMYKHWEQGLQAFKDYLALVGQPADDNTKKLIDYMEIREDYLTKFNYDSFPLQPGMEKIKEETKEMEIKPYQGYTKKQRIYVVSFKVPIITAIGGIEGKEGSCSYDYLVNVSRTNEIVKVSGIKLLGCSGTW